jgi:mRNA-degrading endonuclease RelE of RelBE toxin-antitoxin system
VYEVQLEKAAENDLKRLPRTTFNRIIPHIKALAENPRPSSCRKLTVQRMTGVLELETIASFTRLMRRQRP